MVGQRDRANDYAQRVWCDPEDGSMCFTDQQQERAETDDRRDADDGETALADHSIASGGVRRVDLGDQGMGSFGGFGGNLGIRWGRACPLMGRGADRLVHGKQHERCS